LIRISNYRASVIPDQALHPSAPSVNAFPRLLAAALLVLSLLSSSAEIIGLDRFNYLDGTVAGKNGGTSWDYKNTTSPGPAGHFGMPSTWANAFGVPALSAGRLLTDDSGARRAFFGTTEADGAIIENNAHSVVYFRATMTTGDTLPEFFYFMADDNNTERVFFGKLFGSSVFGLAVIPHPGVFSTTAVEPNRTYTLVAKLDYENDKASLFIDPNFLANEPLVPAAVAPFTASTPTTAVRMGSGFNGDPVAWDDLIVATTWEELRDIERKAQVFLNFNGNWRDNLNQSNQEAGIPNFTTEEKDEIQIGIIAEIARIFAGYQVSFATNDPDGNRDEIDFSAPTNSGLLGYTRSNHFGNAGGNSVAYVLVGNFVNSLFTRPEDPPLTPLERRQEIAIRIGKVAAHELSHVYGLGHHHRFGVDSITPETYINTGGAERSSIMSSMRLPVGVLANLNRFERAILDIAGGTQLGGDALVKHPVLEFLESGDAGNTTALAAPLWFSEGETSQARVSLIGGDLNASVNDIDVFRFNVTSPGALSVNLISEYVEQFVGNQLNPKIRLIGPDGVTELALFDDMYLTSEVYNYASYVDFAGFTITVPKYGNDAFMVNFPVSAPGTYYLEVSAVSKNAGQNRYQMLSVFTGNVLPSTGFHAWKLTNFGKNAANPAIAGNEADADGDGRNTLLEYAAGTDPFVHNPGPLLEVTANAGRTLAFVRMPFRFGNTDLIYEVQRSLDLVTWSRALEITPTYIHEVNPTFIFGQDASSYSFSDSSIAGQNQYFYRLIVTGIE
jgi:hypothetical protein